MQKQDVLGGMLTLQPTAFIFSSCCQNRDIKTTKVYCGSLFGFELKLLTRKFFLSLIYQPHHGI